MPLVAHSSLPSFERLREDGEEILELERAHDQDIRELHIGLCNIMPDAALEATERQFMRLIGSSNRIAQFYIHPFTLKGIERGAEAQKYIDTHYTDFQTLRSQGVDALIVTGANVQGTKFEDQPFWNELTDVFEFAAEQVTSTLCACLATHAAMKHFKGIERVHLGDKCWGVFSHRTTQFAHPLVRNIDTRFNVPHSRFNDISKVQVEESGMCVLVTSDVAGVHLAVSEDLFRFVFFQGHPEYDRNSLFKEYKREVGRYIRKERPDYPPFPENYLSAEGMKILSDFQAGELSEESLKDFPEDAALMHVDNTWGDTARSIFNNWIGMVYQLTNRDRTLPFMDGVDAKDPLGLCSVFKQASGG